MADPAKPLGDPSKPFWTIADIAVYLDVKEKSVREYRTRGELPVEQEKVGQSPIWPPAVIIEWKQNRPGSGARTDLKKDT